MGANGCGKSCLLSVLGNREVPIQEHIDIYYLGECSCATIYSNASVSLHLTLFEFKKDSKAENQMNSSFFPLSLK